MLAGSTAFDVEVSDKEVVDYLSHVKNDESFKKLPEEIQDVLFSKHLFTSAVYDKQAKIFKMIGGHDLDDKSQMSLKSMINPYDSKEMLDLYMSRLNLGIESFKNTVNSGSSIRKYLTDDEISQMSDSDNEAIKNLEKLIQDSDSIPSKRDTSSFIAAVIILGMRNDSLNVFRDITSMTFTSDGKFLNELIRDDDSRKAVIEHCKTYAENPVNLEFYLQIEDKMPKSIESD